MTSVRFWSVWGLVWIALCADGAEPDCPIVPTPKVYRDTGRTLRLSAAAILLGEKAEEPERYAAERLQTLIARRFKRRLPIHAEGNLPNDARQVLLLGQRATNAWLDRLCKEKSIDLSSTSPGPDGFVIEAVEDAGRDVILIGGSDARGVIYGQDALFDLLRREGDEIACPAVSIRDWPSIPWRGRPHSRLQHHLVPGAFDAYARARLNFSDLRDDRGRKASMGFPAGAEINEPVVKQIVAEAHRRGMFEYATVSCSVERDRFDAVIKTFEALIALGVDGLWVSFDDTGAGKDSPELIRRILDLGKRHDMTGRRIATTPPGESYGRFDTDFNRMAARLPEFDDALWFFTHVPCKEDVEAARGLGLKRLPAWWHNLVDMRAGFLYDGHVCFTMRADGKPGYLDMQPLAKGWHAPDYERLRDAAKYTDTVMLWGLCDGWPEEYELSVLGIWAWDPARHDWARTRRAIYSYIYGPSMAETAQTFDDKLAELKLLFELPLRPHVPHKDWPCRLKQRDDAPKALKMLDELDALLATLEAGAAKETAIDPARLASVYLEPMRATLAYGRKMAQLDYPEYSLGDLEDQVLSLVGAGKEDEAEKRLAEVRDNVTQQVDRVAKELDGLKYVDKYAAFWREQMSGVDYWKKLAAARRAETQKRLDRLMSGDQDALFPNKKPDGGLDALFSALSHPPDGAALVELPATDWLRAPARWRGTWGVGPFESNGRRTVAIGYPPRAPSQAGDYAEVGLKVPVPAFHGRLFLDVFVNDTRLDDRWRGYRFMQLWVNDRMVWEEDIAPPRDGREWVSVDVTDQAKAGRLSLRFRVVEKKGVSNHATATFLGALRLRDVQAKQ